MIKPPRPAAALCAAALGLCLCAAAAKPQSDLERAKEAAARGSEAKALSLALAALKAQLQPDRDLFAYATELLPEHKTPEASILAAVAGAGLRNSGDDPAWDLGLCKALRVAGKAAAALAHCRRAQGLDPLNYSGYRELGLTYGAAGNHARAAETLALGAELSTATCQARQHLGAAQEKAADLKAARASFTLAVSLAAADPSLDAGFCKARAAAGLRRLDRRDAELKAKVKEPSPPDRERRYAACMGKFREAVKADRLLDSADTAAGCLKLIHDDPPLAAQLAPVLVRLGRYEQGVSEYERAAALHKADKPEAARLRVNAAETWLKLDKPQQALAQYQLGAEADPANLTCLRGLAETLDARAMFPAALENYEKVLKLEPGNARAKVRAEELRTTLLTNEEIMAELRARRALPPKKITLQPEDIAYFQALRAAEMNGAVEFVRDRAQSQRGLFVQRETPQGMRVHLSETGYRAYVALATRDAITLFERQKVGMREIFKLRSRLGDPIFDKDGKLTPEGAAVWRKALDGEKTWLMPYEAVPESPRAVQAAKDISAAQAEGYRELSEPEYLWLLKFTNCPDDILRAAPINLKVITDGARVRYLLCYVSNSQCMTKENEPLPPSIEDYRAGRGEDLKKPTHSSFFGIAGPKRRRFCENGKIWDGN